MPEDTSMQNKTPDEVEVNKKNAKNTNPLVLSLSLPLREIEVSFHAGCRTINSQMCVHRFELFSENHIMKTFIKHLIFSDVHNFIQKPLV